MTDFRMKSHSKINTISLYIKKLNEESKQLSDDKKDGSLLLSNINIKSILKSKSVKLFSFKSDLEEICDLKNIGNLSNVSFDEQNSFLEDSSSTPINEVKENKENNVKNQSIRFDQFESEDEIAKEIHSKIVFSQIISESEMLADSQHSRDLVRKHYINGLEEIRLRSSEMLKMKQINCEKNSLSDYEKLQNLKINLEEESDQIEQSYVSKMKEKKQQITQEVEAVKMQYAQENLSAILNELILQQNEFQNHLIHLQNRAKILPPESDVCKVINEELPAIYVSTYESIVKLTKQSASQNEIVVTMTRIASALKVIADLSKILDNFAAQSPVKENDSKPPIAQQNDFNQAISQQNDSKPPIAQQNESKQPISQQNDSKPPISQQTEASSSNATPSVFHSSSSDEPAQTQSEKAKPAEKKSEVSAIVLEKYNKLKELYDNVMSESKSARNDASLRPVLSRAIGVLNTFSNDKVDSSNRSKLSQIFNLLGGRPCTVGNDTINVSNNPSAQAFIKEQISSKIISLSNDKQISSMAIYASLIVRIWQYYPDVGDLILYNLYQTCPFLSPLPLVATVDSKNSEEFYRSLGFRQKDNVLEGVDKYLTRMGASAKLYGRIISMEVDKQPHPHGIEEGWMWLASILASTPYPSVTASLLNGFLSTAGFRLLEVYKNQFRKLLSYLCSDYIKKVESEVLEGGHSDTVALKNFLNDYIKNNAMAPVSEGYKLLI